MVNPSTVSFALGATTLVAVGSYDSGIIPANVAPGYGQSINAAPAQVTGQAARLDVSDPTNPDGFLNIPLAYAGPAWQPLIGPSWDSTVGRDDTTDEVVTQGGQEFPINRFTRRRWVVALNAVKQSEVWVQLGELDRASRAGGNVLFVPDYTSANLPQEAIYGRCKPIADVSFPYQAADARAWKANITERL
jgi:hypothetical protein